MAGFCTALIVKHAISPSMLRQRLRSYPHKQLAGVADAILVVCLRQIRFHWAVLGAMSEQGATSTELSLLLACQSFS